MSLSFYSANAKNTGAMVSVSFNSKDRSVWFRLIKQTGSQKSSSGGTNGTYKGGQSINIKFNVDEVGGIIRSARFLEPLSLFHKSPTTQTSIQLSPYEIKSQNADKPPTTRYGLSFKQGDGEYKIGLSVGQAETLAQYLEFSLGHIFSADYAEDKKRALENKAKKPSAENDDSEGTEEQSEAPSEPEESF